MVITQKESLADAVEVSGVRKAAIITIMLGEQVASEILRLLDENEVEEIGREVARIHSISNEQAEAVLEECYQMSLAHDYVIKGGLDYARKMLVSAFGPETATKMLDRVMKTLGDETATFDALQKADPQQLARFIHSEHPQTIALILSHLNASQAAGLLSSLPIELRADVAQRMASLDQISPDIISKIAAIVGGKLKTLGEISRESYGGVRAVAEMFNRLDSNTSKEILDNIENSDPTLVASIRHLMFVFEDLLLVPHDGIKETLARIDRKLLTIALKGTSEQLRDHFMEAMSQRGAEMLREDMEALGPVKIKEVEAAQQQIIAVVRQLESEGTINLKGAVGEQYVV
ncbi:MAG TPA: flagellar motor switch protein FliG [Bryobacteraceae bacterium]|nr:flagellar motor switch protein FliG [Bryobacteraceae bacterium]